MRTSTKQLKTMLNVLITLGVCIMCCVWCVASDYSTTANNWVGACVIYLSLYVIWRYRDNIALTILFLFIGYVNYSIVVGVYWFPEIRPYSLYRQISMPAVYGEGIISLLIFELIIFLGAALGKKKPKLKPINISTEPNMYADYACLAVFLVIFFSIFQFNHEARASTSPLSEYRYIPALFGAVYSNKNKTSRLLWTCAIGLTSILSFLGGNRVNTLPSVVLLVLLWYPHIKTKHILALAPFAIILLQMVGHMRYNFSFSAESILQTVEMAWEDKFVADTFTFAYMPSVATLELASIDGAQQKLMLLWKNIVYIFMGGDYGASHLSHYSRNFYTHYSGFLAPLYFNYWAKWVGPVITAGMVQGHVYLIRAIDWRSPHNRSLQFFLAACTVIVVPRWYMYNILQLPRIDFIILVAWLVVGQIAKWVAPRKRLSEKNRHRI